MDGSKRLERVGLEGDIKLKIIQGVVVRTKTMNTNKKKNTGVG